jgi:hypothetical protein
MEATARPLPVTQRETAIVLAACALALVSAPLVLLPSFALAAMIAFACLVSVVALRPSAGAYLLISTTPLIAGIERGQLIPLLRPNEAVLLVVALGLALRGLTELARGATWRPRPSALEWALLAVAASGSIVPLLWMIARGREITSDDLLYASYLWKYAALFFVVRACVRTEPQVRTCLWLSMFAAVCVAAVAILQSLGLFGVPGLVGRWFGGSEAELAGGGRGTATLGSSFAVADVMLFNLAIAVAWILSSRDARRQLLFAAAVVFTLGTVAAGQFSGFLGLGIAVVTLGLTTRRLRRVLLLWPVVGGRLADFSAHGLPPSWIGPNGRWANLTTFFWPDLFHHGNWLTGVQVSARVPAPEPWRDWVWIESGHTWLLWSGGVTLFVACFVFLAVAIRKMARIARKRRDAVGVAAVAALVALWANVFLMTLDVHLTMRGSADLLFTLLALAMSAPLGRRPQPGATTRPDQALPATLVSSAPGRAPGASAMTDDRQATPSADLASEQVAAIVAAAERMAHQMRETADRIARERIADADRVSQHRLAAAAADASEISSAAQKHAESILRQAREESRTLVTEAASVTQDALARGIALSEALDQLASLLKVNASKVLEDVRRAQAQLTAQLGRLDRSRELPP